MPEPSPSTVPPLHALLVGIDRYEGPADGRPGHPIHLYGAVRDAQRMEDFLTRALRVPGERIDRLLAPHTGGDPALLPTSEALREALLRLERACAPGEQALLYYTGHGVRATTRLPKFKGETPDECLAPVDAALGAAYLHDVEIAAWLARLAARGVFVTLILDCCHSGGATRRNRRVKGVEEIDTSRRPEGSPIAAAEEIAAVWRAAPPRAARWRDTGMTGGGGRQLYPAGCAVLAACQADERALEDKLPDGTAGVFTDALLKILERGDQKLTYASLLAEATAWVHRYTRAQTPLAEGEVHRAFLGVETWPARPGYEVREVRGYPYDDLELAAGRLHGTSAGARFRIFPGFSSHTNGFAPDVPLAEAEILEVDSLASRARLHPVAGASRALRPGDRAVLADPGPHPLTCSVGWADDLPVGDETDGCGTSRLAALIHDFAEGFLTAAPRGEAAEFQIGVVDGRYQIRDRAGEPLPNQEPGLPVSRADSSRELIRRLGHLARYRLVEILDNPDLASPLERALRVDLTRIERSEVTRSVRPAVHSAPGLRPGEGLRITIENVSDRRLHLAVLDLRPDWGISQVYPDTRVVRASAFGPGDRQEIDLWASLPTGLTHGTDLLKIFAATQPLDLSALERPALAAPSPTRGPHRGTTLAAAHPLARLVGALAAERPITRSVRGSEMGTAEWWVVGVEVRVG